MRDWATGLAAGAMVAVVLAGGAVGALELWGPQARPKPPRKPPPAVVTRIGPDGSSRTFFGDDVEAALIRGSDGFDLCIGEMKVQRPSRLTTDMPDAYCAVTRTGRTGPWRISTGGWQACQALCVKLRR